MESTINRLVEEVEAFTHTVISCFRNLDLYSLVIKIAKATIKSSDCSLVKISHFIVEAVYLMAVIFKAAGILHITTANQCQVFKVHIIIKEDLSFKVAWEG